MSKKKPVVKKDGEILDGASIIYAGAFLWDDEISIGKNTVIESGALIKGPAIIGNNSEIRQGAYIRWVLVRYSGTQPICRVMVEGPTKSDTEKCATKIANVVKEKLN